MTDRSESFGGSTERARPSFFRGFAGLASIGNAFFVSPTAKHETDIVEKKTKTKFPVKLCDLEGGRCVRAFGVGHRQKRIVAVPVDVYSVGMYADSEAVKSALRRHRGKSVSELGRDPKVLEQLKGSSVEKQLRFVITFGRVTEEAFWSAFSERLTPCIPVEKAPSVMPAFQKHFQGRKFSKGTEVRLALSRSGAVDTFVNGVKTGSVKSPDLAAALVDVYLGSHPPSKDMKDDFLNTASAMLAK